MTANSDVTPQDIIDFWFPDGPNPDAQAHMDFWMWRMRGGADAEIKQTYADITHHAAQGDLDDWAVTPTGRLALIILLDQFSRTIWAGTPQAFAQDPKALALCLEGLDNGHFDALANVWYKSVFKLPLEHCECPDHLANLDRAIAIADALREDAPEQLEDIYKFGAGQPRKHKETIVHFGRHSHRNAILGRESSAAEQDYIEKGAFPHEISVEMMKAQD